MKRPTVSALMAEIEVLKKRVAELEGKKQPAKDPNEEILRQLRKISDQQEKERLTRGPVWPSRLFPPLPSYTSPNTDQYWLGWPPGTVTC